MCLKILKKNESLSYLFSNDAFKKFDPQEEVFNEVKKSYLEYEKYFNSIKKTIENKECYLKYIQDHIFLHCQQYAYSHAQHQGKKYGNACQ